MPGLLPPLVQLLVFYGFVIPGNKYEYYEITTGMAPDVSRVPQRPALPVLCSSWLMYGRRRRRTSTPRRS